jgi:hypothetical protein
MFDKTGLAEEISVAINGSESGEVRIRWTTQNGQRVVEVVRSGTWVPDPQSALWDLAESGPTGLAQVELEGGRRAKKAARRSDEVRKILDLIEAFGVEAVKLETVQTLLGLAKTSAYHRLTEAREIWSQGVSA